MNEKGVEGRLPAPLSGWDAGWDAGFEGGWTRGHRRGRREALDQAAEQIEAWGPTTTAMLKSDVLALLAELRGDDG